MAEPESTVINTHVKQKDPSKALVIAVTTRAIFDLEEEHKLYLEKGKEEYTRHQQDNQDKPLPPGTAFAFIQVSHMPGQGTCRHSQDEQHFLPSTWGDNTDLERLGLTSTESPLAWRPQHLWCWMGPQQMHCMGRSWPCMSCPQEGVSVLTLTSLCLTGVSAALVFQQDVQAPSTPLRVVFDGDAVLFSDETDQVFREQGLEGAVQYERAMEAVPMGE
ncbi:5NT1A nucleotidase, partial [Columbina picui]|nr:5NT1A nucleotidase [Columbina picui]